MVVLIHHWTIVVLESIIRFSCTCSVHAIAFYVFDLAYNRLYVSLKSDQGKNIFSDVSMNSDTIKMLVTPSAPPIPLVGQVSDYSFFYLIIKERSILFDFSFSFFFFMYTDHPECIIMANEIYFC